MAGFIHKLYKTENDYDYNNYRLILLYNGKFNEICSSRKFFNIIKDLYDEMAFKFELTDNMPIII